MTEADVPPEHALETLAMEHVLGLLDAPEAAAAAARVEADPAFAAAVEKWVRNCAPLLLELPSEPAPIGLWRAIAQRIAPVQPAPFAPRPAERAVWEGLWRNLGFWRAAAFAAAAAALLLALRPSSAPPSAPPSAPLLALLEPSGAEPAAAAAAYDPAVRRLVISASFEAPAGRSAELWLIPPGGEAVSLGLLHARNVELTLAPAHAALAQAGAALAVTIEPPGGAPQGVATGPLISKGALARS